MSIAAPSETVESVLSLHEPPVRLDATSAGMAMTAAEFDAVRDWDRDYRFELVRGVVVASPAVSLGGRYPRIELVASLHSYARTEKGRNARVTVLHEHDIFIGDDRRRADLVVWCGISHEAIAENAVPTIAVEIVSKEKRDRHRDYVEKRAEYLAAGVREYWVFDRFRRTLTVCTTPTGDAGMSIVKADGSYRTDLLPGFVLSIGDLLAEADRAGE